VSQNFGLEAVMIIRFDPFIPIEACRGGKRARLIAGVQTPGCGECDPIKKPRSCCLGISGHRRSGCPPVFGL